MRLDKFLNFKNESVGASATEFAFMAPVLITMSLCLYECMNYINLHTKLNEITSMITYCSASKTTQSNIQDCFVGGWLLGKDYNFSTKGTMVATGITTNSQNQHTVVWQVISTGGASALVMNSSSLITSTPIPLTNDAQNILVEVTYTYTPFYTGLTSIFPSKTISKALQCVPLGTGIFTPLPAS